MANKIDAEQPVNRLPAATPPDSLPPEFELGNVEYKLILPSSLTRCRFEHLVTQMKWRLMEGLGEAVYEIGVADDGQLKGLTRDDLNASLATLRRMANHVGASMTIIRRRTVAEHTADVASASGNTAVDKRTDNAREICEVLVRRIPADDQGFIDIRLSLLGDADAGKSTLLGVLSSGERDNGKGRARLNLFRHPHEILTGRTSSVSNEIIGFDDRGRLVNYAKVRTAEEICAKSTKLLTLTDLCGHKRYLRTTVTGLVGHKPDFIMIVINSVQFNDTYASNLHQLALARAVGAPIFMVLTKIDLIPCSHACGDHVQKSIRRLIESAVGGRRVPLIIESEDDAVSAAVNMQSESIVPVFRVSCKTGENLDLLIKFLNMLPPGRTLREKERLLQVPTVFSVMQWYRLPMPVGIVLAGFVEAGIIRPHDQLLLGPDRRGQFMPVRVTSIHRYKSSCRMAKAGEAASVAVEGLTLDCALRKGLFLVHADVLSIDDGNDEFVPPVMADEILPSVSLSAVIGKCCHSFRAEVQIYRKSCRSSSSAENGAAFCTSSNPRTLNVGTHLSLHVGNVVQTAVVAEVLGTMKRINSELPSTPPSEFTRAEHLGVKMRNNQHRATAHAHARMDRLRKTQSCVNYFSDDESFVMVPSAAVDRPQSTTGTADPDIDDARRSCVFTAEFSNDIDSASSSREVLTHGTADDDGNSQESRHLHTHAEQMLIVFEFLQRPEFVLLNSKLVLRQNRETIGIGKVIAFVDVIEPVTITRLWPSAATNKILSVVINDVGGDAANDLPSVSATPPASETVLHDASFLAPREMRCMVQSNAADCTIEQQIRRTHQQSLSPSAATPMFNNDLVGFDSHSPLTMLSYLDDDD